jgi:hypothetical protein
MEIAPKIYDPPDGIHSISLYYFFFKQDSSLSLDCILLFLKEFWKKNSQKYFEASEERSIHKAYAAKINADIMLISNWSLRLKMIECFNQQPAFY